MVLVVGTKRISLEWDGDSKRKLFSVRIYLKNGSIKYVKCVFVLR